MLIEFHKTFNKAFELLPNSYSKAQIEIIKKVMFMITNKKLSIGDYDNHRIGKLSSNKYEVFDCHPLYEESSTTDLVLLYSYDKKQKRVLFIDIGTHKEVFGN